MSNGGTTFTAQVFQWNGSGLTLLTEEANAKWGSNTDDRVCFTVNARPEPAPWSFTPKGGAAGTFPAFQFFEGGIDITQFSNLAGGCFSSFMAETRSSTSTTSTLKDFALGNFNTCKVEIVKNCLDVSFDPAAGLLTYGGDITVTNSGFGTLFDLVVTETPQGAPQQQFQLASLGQGSHTSFRTRSR